MRRICDRMNEETKENHIPAWGGHTNGYIPASALEPVPATYGPYLRPDAAAAYFRLNDAFASRFGKSLAITEAYRDYGRQVYLYDGYINGLPGFYLAAVPGTSNHGWGTACDFGANVNVGGSAENNWMDANAPAFGFYPTEPTEPWHFDYTLAYNEQEDDDLTPEQDQRMKNIENILVKDNGGGIRSVLADTQSNAYLAAARSGNLEAIVAKDNGGGLRAAITAIRTKLGA